MTHTLARKIVALFRGGTSMRRIALRLGISRNTVSKAIRPNEQAGDTGPPPTAARGGMLDAYEPAIADLLDRYPGITLQRLHEELRRSGYTGGCTILHKRVHQLRPHRKEESREWMLRVLLCKERSDTLRPLVNNEDDLRLFVNTLKNGKLKDRNRVLAVIAARRGISQRSIAHFLGLSCRTVSSYCDLYRIYGSHRLFNGFHDRLRTDNVSLTLKGRSPAPLPPL